MDLNDASAGWYKRSITAPAEWQGQTTILDFGRLSTDALRLFIITSKNDVMDFSFAKHEMPASHGDIALSGLAGDVVIFIRPAAASVDDVFVQTSVRKHELTLQMEMIGVA